MERKEKHAPTASIKGELASLAEVITMPTVATVRHAFIPANNVHMSAACLLMGSDRDWGSAQRKRARG